MALLSLLGFVLVTLQAVVVEAKTATTSLWAVRPDSPSSNYLSSRSQVDNMFSQQTDLSSKYVGTNGNPSIGINQNSQMMQPTGGSNDVALVPRNLAKGLLSNNQDIVVVLNSTGVGVAQGVGSAIGVSNSPSSGVAIGGSAITTVSQPAVQPVLPPVSFDQQQPLPQTLQSSPLIQPTQQNYYKSPSFGQQTAQPTTPGFVPRYLPSENSQNGKVVLVLDSNGVGVSQGLGSAVGIADSPATGVGIGGSSITEVNGSTNKNGVVVTTSSTGPLIYVNGKVNSMSELVSGPALSGISMTQTDILRLAATSKQFRMGMELGIQLGLRVFK